MLYPYLFAQLVIFHFAAQIYDASVHASANVSANYRRRVGLAIQTQEDEDPTSHILSEKILSEHAGHEVHAGELALIKVKKITMH